MMAMSEMATCGKTNVALKAKGFDLYHSNFKIHFLCLRLYFLACQLPFYLE
jgi:hypothetical protein